MSAVGKSQFVTFERAGPVLTASLLGPAVTEREVSIIQADVTGAIDDCAETLGHLVLDMRRIEFMPSVGIGMCITLHKHAKTHGATSFLLGLNGDLTKIFKLMNLHRLFSLVADEASLAKAIGR